MRNVITLIVFVGVIILILWHPTIRIPKTKFYFQIDYSVAPLLGVLILLISLQITPNTLLAGIIGNDFLQPWMIIELFFSLAYICISLDLTGSFAYLSLLVAKKSGGSVKRLFFSFFLLSSFLTTFTSNDIVILTLTPIIIYFCKYTKINPLPFLIGQFFAANIWSIALYIGNPTNIIVAQAYKLTFLSYSAWMVLPTIFGGMACFTLLFLIFRKSLEKRISPPALNPSSALKDKPGAIFGVTILACCLGMLIIAPIFDLNMGHITLTFAVIVLIKDFSYSIYRTAIERKQGKLKNKITIKDTTQHQSVLEINENDKKSENFPLSNLPSLEITNQIGDIATKNNDGQEFQELNPNQSLLVEEQSKNLFHPLTTALLRVPWKIAPFIIGMFILVESLSSSGWVELFASGLSVIQMRIGIFGAVFLMSFLSSIACNFMNNQPMTILFTSILQNPTFMATPVITQASMFALIMGSNFGANFTLIGALAGIMWSSISVKNGVNITYKQFARYGFMVMPLVVALASLILALEFIVIF